MNEEYVIAVTKLVGRICVLCGSAGQPTAAIVVLVFEDGSPFGLQRRIRVQEIRRPWDMVSSRVDNCLYVTDLESRSIWKIEGGDDYKLTLWLSGIGAPFTLSLSGDGQLCLTRIGQPLSSLEIYGPDSQLCLSILLPEEMKDTLHAVETSTGNFVILYRRSPIQKTKDSERRTGGSDSPDGVSSGGNLMWGVSEVTRDGLMVINSFVPADESKRLNHPEHLVSSVDSDLVFVADTRNDRVIQLNSDLTWNQTLIPTHQMDQPTRRINWPKRLHYDEHSKQLLVVGGFYAGVHIYTFH